MSPKEEHLTINIFFFKQTDPSVKSEDHSENQRKEKEGSVGMPPITSENSLGMGDSKANFSLE